MSMENNMFTRTEALVGTEQMERLKKSSVIVFGVGGVGGYVIESLARAGIGQLTIVDCDTIDITNLNRQIIALHSNVGKIKVEVMGQRLNDINPQIVLKEVNCKVTPENIEHFHIEDYDYVVDAIDDVKAKIAMIKEAKEKGSKIISCMGTGNKVDPTKLQVAQIEKTSICPLAKAIRKELKKLEITKVKVVFSTEMPQVRGLENGGKIVPASIAFVPAAAGLLLGSEVVKDLISE